MTIIWSLDVSALDASGVQRGRSAYKRQNKSSLKVNSLKKNIMKYQLYMNASN